MAKVFKKEILVLIGELLKKSFVLACWGKYCFLVVTCTYVAQLDPNLYQ